VTEKEIALLHAICETDHKVYTPESRTLGTLQAFDELVAALQQMQKAGWIELEVRKSGGVIRGYRRKYKGAAARCTKQGQEALTMLGES
jgi:hypothetical protein